MMTASLRKAPLPVPKLTRTQLDELVRRREALDDSRRRLGREADALAGQIRAIDRDLAAVVDAESGPDRTLNLKHWRLSIVQVKCSVSWLSEFTKRLGRELAEEIKQSAATRDKLLVESRDKPAQAA